MKKKTVRIDHLANHWNILLTAISTVIVIIGVITTSYLTRFETRINSQAADLTPIPTQYCHAGDWVCPEYPGHPSNCANAATRQLFTDTWCDPQCQWLWQEAGNSNACAGEQSTLKSNNCPNPPKVCGNTVPSPTNPPYVSNTPIPATATKIPTPTPNSYYYSPTPDRNRGYLSPTPTLFSLPTDLPTIGYYFPTNTPTPRRKPPIGGANPTSTPTQKPKPTPTETLKQPTLTSKPTITMASLPSITSIPTITPFPTTPPPPTATPIPPIGPLGCKVEPIDVHGNPNDKYDVLFLSQGFTNIDDFKKAAQDAVSSVSSSNFNSAESNYLYNKLNFWMNADISTNYSVVTPCVPGQQNSVCWNFPAAEFDTHAKCNADGYIIIINSSGDGAMALIGRGAALSKKYISGTAHELGHVICILNDEYVGYPGIVNFLAGIPNTNCSQTSPCMWQNRPGMECIQGCTDANWYRSSKNSIMNNWLSNKDFNRLSLAWCSAGLQNFR